MAAKTNSVFTLGTTIISDDTANRVCDRLDIVCELSRGNFRFVRDGGCIHFIAPRQLGSASSRIAQALLHGLRIGLLY